MDQQVAALVRARGDTSVAKYKLLNIRERYPSGPLIVVEGDEDRPVYAHWLFRLSPDLAYEFFVCNGKRSAKKLVTALAEDKSDLSHDIYFFVDRDFDDLKGFQVTDNIMMLEGYSFENYLVDERVLENLLRLAFPLDAVPNLRKKITETFSDDYDNFLAISADVNRIIFVARHTMINVDDAIPKGVSDIATVALNDVRPVGKDASDVIRCAVMLNDPSHQNLHDEFSSLDPRMRYRGKFAMKFFMTWLSELISELKHPRIGLFADAPRSDTKIINTEISFGAMAARSSIPERLLTFLKEQGLST